MEYFGFGSSSDLSTPIGVMVKAATDSLRISPDWAKNMEICDQINLHKDNVEMAMRAIRRRLMDSDHMTVSLALTLLETCMKNCGSEFAARFDRNLMDEVVNVAVKENKGLKNKEEALRLIQQWGRAYETRRSIPLFFETFMGLKARGISFPKEDENVTVGYDIGENRPALVQRSTSAAVPPPAGAMSTKQPAIPEQEEDEFIRLQQDLSVVMEKVRLCREILQVSPGIKEDDALADIVGFLEACRDRMVDVIEAGTQGLLGEDLFALCLKVNDAVLRTLEAEKNGVKIPIDDEDGESAKPTSNEGNLLDLSPLPAENAVPTQKFSSIEEDLFGSLESRVAKSAQPQTQPLVPPPVVPPQPVTADPFGGAFGSYPSVAPGNSHYPAPEVSHNPFDEFSAPAPPVSYNNVASPVIPAIPPPYVATQGPASTQASVQPPPPPLDDFDALFNATPTKPSQSNSNGSFVATVSTKKDSELEDFFATLDVSK